MIVNGLHVLPVPVKLEFLGLCAGSPGQDDAAGYAIEYDTSPNNSRPGSKRGGEHLFFPGQINGTTGYEELRVRERGGIKPSVGSMSGDGDSQGRRCIVGVP